MASLTLKVTFTRSKQSKTLRFRSNMTVAEACRMIAQREGEGGPEYGLFQAKTSRNKQRWLRQEKTLEFYELRNDDKLEYKKRMRPLKVKLEDGTVKTVLIDDSHTVAGVVETIGKKMNLKNFEEFTLKYDTKDQWLNSGQSLTEQGLGDRDMVVLKKRFFVNDFNVDRSDPVQLHLVYAQSKNSILAGDHPLTLTECANLTALVCQIVHGDYNPSMHKPGFLDKQMLPPQYQGRKSEVEPPLISEYKKLVGMTEINAKYRYLSDVRKLKTYGITTFIVGQKVEGKKKPAQRRLGVTRDAILILDGETRDIVREFPLTHLRRWAASPKNFTLDFGDYEDDYLSLLTLEGEAISQLIGGYIDILLKKRKDAARVLDDDSALTATIGEVGGVRAGLVKGSRVTRGRTGPGGDGAGSGTGDAGHPLEYVKGPHGMQIKVTDLAQANRALLQMLDEAAPGGDFSKLNASSKSCADWRKQMLLESAAVKAQSGELQQLLENPNGMDHNKLNACASKMGESVGALLNSARLASHGVDGDPALLDSARLLAAAVAKMLKDANNLRGNPDDPEARMLYASAREEFDANHCMLNATCQGKLADEADQRLLLAQAKAVAAAANEMLAMAENSAKSVGNEELQQSLMKAARRADGQGAQLLAVARTLAPTIVDQECRGQLMFAGKNVKGSSGALLAASKAAGVGGQDYKNLLNGAKAVSDAIAALMRAAEAAEARKRGDAALQAAVNRVVIASQSLGDSAGKPRKIIENTKLMAQCQSRLMAVVKAKAQSIHNPDERQALLDAARSLAASTQALVDSAKVAAQNPKDPNSGAALRNNAADTEAKARHLGKVGNRGGQLQLLRANAKYATAATTELRAAITPARARTGDAQMDDSLLQAAKASADSMQRLLQAVYSCDQNNPNAFNQLAETAKACVGEAFPLVATSKRAVPKIRDTGAKQNVQLTANEAQGAIKRLMDSTRVERSAGSEDFDDAFATLSDDASALDQAVLSLQQGSLRPQAGQTKEASIAQLQSGARQLGGASMEAAKAANTPAMLGPRSKTAAETSSQVVRAARGLAACVDDRDTQAQLLEKAKVVNAASMDMLAAAQTVADDGQRENKVALAQAAKANAAAVAALVRYAKSTETDGVDLALVELQKAMKMLNPRPPASGGDFKVPAAQLVQASNAVDVAAQALAQGAQLRDRKRVDAAAKQLAGKLPLLVTAANAAASAAPEQQTRVAIVQHSRAALQATGAVLQNAKRGQPVDASQVSQSLGQLSSTCDIMTPDERQIADALAQYDQAAADLGASGAVGTNYAQATQELSASTKALLQAMSRLQAASKAGQKGMPQAFTGVAQAMPRFVQAADAAAAVSPPEARVEFENATSNIATRGGDFLRQAQCVYEQPRNPPVQQALASEYRNTATAVRSLVAAIDKGATGAKATDSAIAQVERLHQELTSGVFDVQVPPGATFESELAEAGRAAPACASTARDFASLPVGDQSGMGSVSSEAASAAIALAQHTKCAVRAADADDKQQAQALVERVRPLLGALRVTLRAGKDYQANASNQKAATAMRNAAAGAAKHAAAVQQLAAAAAAGPEVTDGERALDDAQQRLRDMLAQYHAGAYAGAPSVAEGQEADEVVGTARQVAAEAAGIAAATDDVTLRDAAVSSVLAAEQLLQRTAAVEPTAADDAGRRKLHDASGSAIDALVQLCEAGKLRSRRNNVTSQQGVNDAAAAVGSRVNDVVSAANDTLPKKQSTIDTGENLEELAESELANCAREIAKAAAMLMQKPSRVRNAGLDAFDAVADAILDAAQNIAMATQQLVIVATKAQKEIAAASDGSPQGSVYMKDPAWARGLISAAQAVAGNVKLLVTAANKAASSEGSEEELVACGRGVAAATIRLVTAARAKADPFSPTQQELKKAAGHVQRATDELVTHAKQYSNVVEVQDEGPDLENMSQVRKMKFMREQESELAALEAQLLAEQNNLLKMQRERYNDANGK